MKIDSSKRQFFPELPHVQDEICDCHVESGKEGVKFGRIRMIESRKGRVEFRRIQRINSEKDNEGGSQLQKNKSYQRIILGSNGGFQNGEGEI